jgi:hypothetical protein
MNRDKHPHAAGQTLGIANDPVVTLTPAPTPVPKTVSEMRDEARRCLETAKTTAEPEVRTHLLRRAVELASQAEMLQDQERCLGVHPNNRDGV